MLPISAEAKAKIRILVVDDEPTLRGTCATVLRMEGYDVTVCARGQDAVDALGRRRFDIVLADLFMPQVDGLAVLRAALAANAACLVIVMTGNPSVDSSLHALREGAWNYLPKPFSAAHLEILVARAAHTLVVADETEEREAALATAQAGATRFTLLGTSPAFRRAIELARRVALTDASVFITGESGSGKEVVAQYIHHHSRRSSRPFVAVNCAAIPETLLESEMFGHKKGAFTGAVRDKPGLLETANGGTLFLDELGEMPKSLQAKLLRVIQDGVVRRVGSESTDAVVNVRFISATNRDAAAAVHSGDLREDLYYRLCVVPIQLPALRERPEDLPLLADHFLTQSWSRHRVRGAERPELTESALRALATHPWRGNVRELQNVIEHVAVFAEPGARLTASDLQINEEHGAAPVEANTVSLVSSLLEDTYHNARERILAQFETQYFTWLINRAGGNVSQAARLAGVDRTTLYRLMERHKLHRNLRGGWVIESEPEPGPGPEPGSAHPDAALALQ
ncbi:MAG: sigma-54-dependent transcriptional regulator [Gemmatimonadales bacterium]